MWKFHINSHQIQLNSQICPCYLLISPAPNQVKLEKRCRIFTKQRPRFDQFWHKMSKMIIFSNPPKNPQYLQPKLKNCQKWQKLCAKHFFQKMLHTSASFWRFFAKNRFLNRFFGEKLQKLQNRQKTRSISNQNWKFPNFAKNYASKFFTKNLPLLLQVSAAFFGKNRVFTRFLPKKITKTVFFIKPPKNPQYLQPKLKFSKNRKNYAPKVFQLLNPRIFTKQVPTIPQKFNFVEFCGI